MSCIGGIRCGRCWRSWSGCPGWNGCSWPRSPTPSWPSTWRRSPGRRCRPSRWRVSTSARRATRSTPSSCWPPAPATPGSSCRRPSPRCCWPGSRGCRSRPSGSCGVGAVAGRRVPSRLLAGVAGLPEADLEQGLHEAVGDGVLTTDAATGSYAFRHALLQEAVYGDLLPGEQVRLHAAYARLLADDPDGAPAELAHHCLASHDLAGALAASVRAAEEAEAVLAPAEALRHLHSALGLWERVPEPDAAAGIDRVELLLRAAAAASAAGELQRAASLAQDAARTAGATEDPAQAARAYERFGLYLFYAGRVEEAVAARARALELVPPQPPTRLRARVTAAMAQALVNARQPAEARRWCDEALAAARGAGSADEEADALITLGMIEQ